ncbi:LPS assembly lipoprotein LptE [Methyloligella sp. 2.7D]|uniref:LPS assembly lipoprotein LptE n=1 Tax=unclassified Methyloligella TaxID=2625955 RepID=UPI00157CDA5C|nr:LPS assembly lipoprotein LptE [Methyloligella sp. GL2]QKP76263.1 hypothetical protein HT051_01630 [Methyloligella sp. GL2]
MSWRNRQTMPRLHGPERAGFAPMRRTLMAFALLAGAGLMLAGCGGVRPLYGTSTGGQDVKNAMAAVDVQPIPGRVGQQVRNELIFTNTGGGQAPQPRYRLNIVLKESLLKSLVRRSGEATSETVQLQAQFKLVDMSNNKVLKEGNALSRAVYDRYEKTFSNVRAKDNAENRAAKQIAEMIRTQVAAYLATQT